MPTMDMLASSAAPSAYASATPALPASTVPWPACSQIIEVESKAVVKDVGGCFVIQHGRGAQAFECVFTAARSSPQLLQW